MKIAILGDMHIGIRNDSEVFYEYQKKFFLDIFFPHLQKHKIKNVIQVGDFFDRRQYISFKTLHYLMSYFPHLLEKHKVSFNILLGNHDTSLKSSNHINSPSLLLQHIKNINVIEDFKDIILKDNKEEYTVGILPWINNNNLSEAVSYIESTKVSYVFGHLELAGFEMHKGQLCESGMNMDLFSKFNKVITGHFHTKSNKGNILYTGTPYELSWSDHNDTKGFYVLDTDTHEIEFIENPYTLFHKIDYTNNGVHEYENITPACETLEGKYVKLICHKKVDDELYENYLKRKSSEQPIDIHVSIVSSESENEQIDDNQVGKTFNQMIIDSVNNASENAYSESVKSNTIELLLNLHNELGVE